MFLYFPDLVNCLVPSSQDTPSNVCGRKERDRKDEGTEGGNVVRESREACSHSVLLSLASVCKKKEVSDRI